MFSIPFLCKSLLLTASTFFFLVHLHSQNLDIKLLRKINPNPPTSGIWKGVSNTSEPISVSIPMTMFVIHLIKKDKDLNYKSAEATAAVLNTITSTAILKLLLNKQRPYQKYNDIYPYKYEDGKSLPSGHTSLAFSTATMLTMQYKKWYIVVPAYAWATTVGYSRLYLGMHYPSDILASAVLGCGSAIATHLIAKKLLRRMH